MWISRDFWGAEAPRIPAFLFCKRALAVSPRFQAVLLFQGGRLFSFSHTIIPCLKKGAGGNGGQKWRIQTKQIPSQTEPDRNTVPTQGLPHRLKSPSVLHPNCARDAPFPGMVFCARVRTENVCARDWWSYLKRRNPNEYAISQPRSGGIHSELLSTRHTYCVEQHEWPLCTGRIRNTRHCAVCGRCRTGRSCLGQWAQPIL